MAEDAKTVFVRGLPTSFSDSQLEEAFGDVGPVRRAFTVKEKATGKHRGFAFVHFALAEDAQRAVDLKDQTLLEGRKIKVVIAKRRATLNERRKKNQAKKVEAGEEDGAVDEKNSRKRVTEKKDGAVVAEKNSKKRERGDAAAVAEKEDGAVVAKKKNEKHDRGDAAAKMVAAEKKDEAAPEKKSRKRERSDAAAEQDKKVPKLSQQQSGGSTKQLPARTVIVGNLSDVESLISLAQKLGTVESVERSISNEYLNEHGLSRDGCTCPAIAIVFTSVRAARDAVATFHHQNSGGCVLWARQLGGEGAKLKKWRLIVRNLSFKVTEEMLRKVFGKAGFLWEITIPRKPDGLSRGFAFVGYTSKSEAEKAISDVNGKKIENRTVAVDWAVGKKKYEELKSGENDENKEASDLERDTASEGGSDAETGVHDEQGESDDANELDLVQKVLDKVVKPQDTVPTETEEDDEVPDENDAEAQSPDNIVESSKPEAETDDAMERTVFMRNLPLEASVNDLRKRFSEFGDIKAFRLVFNPGTRKPKGTAFVEFATREGAEAVVKAAEGAEEGNSKLLTGGRPTIVHFAVDRNAARNISTKKSMDERDRDRRNLYLLKEGSIESGTKAAEGVSKADLRKRQVLEKEKATKLRSPNFHVSKTRLAIHNFPKSLTEKEVKQLFIKAVLSRATKQQPVVKQVKLLTDDKENFRGSGFVEFKEHQHALVALRVLNNNPETFGSEKRPIVEFAIDNMTKLRKRETRMATHKPVVSRNTSVEAEKMQEKPEKTKDADSGGPDEGDAVPARRKKTLKRKSDPGTGQQLSKKLKETKQKPVEESRMPSGNDKKLRGKLKQVSGNKETKPEQPERKGRRQKTKTNVEDKLDKLVDEYRAKYFGSGAQSKPMKPIDSIKRWFE